MNDTIHPEAQPFMPKQAYSRREFVTTTLATGFALAVLPDGPGYSDQYPA